MVIRIKIKFCCKHLLNHSNVVNACLMTKRISVDTEEKLFIKMINDDIIEHQNGIIEIIVQLR